MDWTTKQRETIEKKDSDILVAAAAGSGKTAVLVEKIKRLVIEEKTDIDRFLVVTFTRAAASEMKEKIADALISESEKDPESADFLSKQLEKLSTSSISTFDSFAIDIVRQYFHVIDIEPDLVICEPEEVILMEKEAAEETFDEIYESSDPEMMAFLDAYSGNKNDYDLKEKVISLYKSLMAMPEGLLWLEKAIPVLAMNEEELKASPLIDMLMEQVHEQAARARDHMNAAYSLLGGGDLMDTQQKFTDEWMQAQRAATVDFDEAYPFFNELAFERLTAAKGEKHAFDLVKEQFKDQRNESKKILESIRDRYFDDPPRESVSELNIIYGYANTLLRILRMFEAKFSEKKMKKGQMDFSDSNHFALEILKNKDVADEIREKYDYIFIDEYQDSNYIQEEIISAVKRKDNLFMVGDIKQSIYGFRLAEPDIFRDRYREFSDETHPGTKIDLNTNFRSKKEVIDSVNEIFEVIMDDYDEDAMLYLGDPYDGDISHRSELHIVETDDKEIDAELSKMKNIEFEAKICARVIRENLGKIIYDSKKACERPLEKRDIVVLMRSARNRAEFVYKVLMDEGIEAYIDENGGFFDAVEIQTLTDLLAVIDNIRQDIPLLSVLRSGIFGFSADDLIKVRLAHPKGDYYEAFLSFSEGTGIASEYDPALTQKVNSAISKIREWANKSVYMTASELVSEICEGGYYAYTGALPGGMQRQANIRAFIERAVAYDSLGDGTLFGFLRFIEAMKKNTENPQAQITGEGEDTVRIMTIHKSKGLEYPMVIVCGAGEGIKGPKIDKYGDWHKDIGFVMQYVNTANHYKHNTFLANLINSKKTDDEIEEEIRIYYVACTRAKDKLVIIGSRNQRSANQLSFLSMAEPICGSSFDISRYTAEDFIEPDENTDLSSESKEGVTSDTAGLSEADREKIDRLLSYEYPNQEETLLKSKYSVSELNRKGGEEYRFTVPAFAAQKKKIAGAELGTLMHFVMEHLNFADMKKEIEKGGGSAREYIISRLEDMKNEALLTEEEAAAVRTDKILGFFASDIGKRVLAADRVYKERQFNILHDKDGRSIIVQGIIDCYFEETEPSGDKHLILLDYKTNYDTTEIEKKYAEQMALYKEALEKSTGLPVAESYLYLFSEGRELKIG